MKSPSLDLHGVRHEDVHKELAPFIWKHRSYQGELHIITGYSYIMKKQVRECLSPYAIRRIDDGDIINRGYLRVWLDN